MNLNGAVPVRLERKLIATNITRDKLPQDIQNTLRRSRTLYTARALPQSPANCRQGMSFLFTDGQAISPNARVPNDHLKSSIPF